MTLNREAVFTLNNVLKVGRNKSNLFASFLSSGNWANYCLRQTSQRNMQCLAATLENDIAIDDEYQEHELYWIGEPKH